MSAWPLSGSSVRGDRRGAGATVTVNAFRSSSTGSTGHACFHSTDRAASTFARFASSLGRRRSSGPIPRPFLRGLIHSDGCRVVANDRGRLAPRYLFSNRSEDIKGLFCDSLDALGVRWTRPSEMQFAVYRNDSVAILDRFIGPKR